LITSGHIPPNPAELLSSEGVSRHLDILKEKYDRIIVDSPPIMSATDPVIIGTFIDEVLLVVKAGQTSRDHALTAIRKLQHVKANLIGTVLNSVIAGQDNYYYQQYHYYGEESATERAGLLGRLKGFSIGRK
jgi:capsular exopolysaccharide synthesis family protein